MPNKMLIDATHAEETRVVVVDGNRVEEFDFEAASRRQLTGNIYLAKVTRVEPSLQAAFVDYGGNRHGFLAFSEIHPDYYQIPVADRKALLEEERAFAQAQEEEAARSRRRGSRSRPAAAGSDPLATGAAPDTAPDTTSDTDADPEEAEGIPAIGIPGMDVVEPEGDAPLAPEGEDNRPYAAVDHAAEIDGHIESIADEDVSDEIRPPRRPRAKRYKIQEVIKVRQILLVQVVKEERGNKGAALTTYLSLAGRYCVLMPNTARGGGISRKITNATDRKKLKDIAGALTVPEGAGLIIRTAGAKRTKAEIKRDYEYLQRLWEQIRDLTLRSIAPAPIYEEGDLIKRSIRDLYSREIDEVLVEGEAGYRVAKDFMKMIMPSHAKNVRHYVDPLPIFARYQVESYLGGMFNPTVQLKSGGYIVIGITEALVSIDVNSGRATRQGSVEETALQTNLEAAEEIARQLRLRDLAGLIVIDFIDMEERKNNAAVEKKLKDKLKNDRARIQVGRISGFGLLEMSRQRLRPGMLEATTQPCPHCHGTGLIRSDDSLGLAVLRQIEEEATRGRAREVLLKAPVGIVNFLINQKREHVAQIEARYGMAVRLEADPSLVSPDFTLERFKTATRPVQPVQPVVSAGAALMAEVDAPVAEEAEEACAADLVEQDAEAEAQATGAEGAAPAAEGEAGEGAGGKRRRRRRRRRRGGAGEDSAEGSENAAAVAAPSTPAMAAEATPEAAVASPTAPDAEPAPDAATPAMDAAADATPADTPAEGTAPGPRRRSRSRRRAPASAEAAPETAPEATGDAEAAASDAAGPDPEAAAGDTPPPARRRRRRAPAAARAATEAAVPEGPAPAASAPEAEAGPPPLPETAEVSGAAGPVAAEPPETEAEAGGDSGPAPMPGTAEPAPASEAVEAPPAEPEAPGAATLPESAASEATAPEGTATAAADAYAPAPIGSPDTPDTEPDGAAEEPEAATSGTGAAEARNGQASDGPATPDAPTQPAPEPEKEGSAPRPRRRGWWALSR